MRLAAYDPSLINLGYAFGYLDDDFNLVIESTGTFEPDSVLRGASDPWDISVDIVRMNLIRDYTRLSLLSYLPDAVVIERPYFNGRNPRSLISQSKAWGILDQVIYQHSTEVGIGELTMTYQPIYIKKMAGVKKTEFSDKIGMLHALEAHISAGTLSFVNDEDLPQFNKDHSWDAVGFLLALRATMLLDKE